MRYRSMIGGRYPILAMFGVFGFATVFLIAAAFSDGDNAPSPVFVAVWVTVLGWNAYWFLFRLSVDLTLLGDRLVSETPLRRCEVSLGQLLAVRPMKLSSSVIVIEVLDERPILTFASKGFSEFANAITEQRPDLLVRHGWQARLAERMPGNSRAKRR